MDALTRTEQADVTAVAERIHALVYATYGNQHHPAYNQDDVYQAAMEAVCRARKRWNPALASFPTYAHNRAKGAILDFLRDQRPGTRRHPREAPSSLDEILDQDDGTTRLDRLAYTDPDPHDHLLEHQLWQAVNTLTPRVAAAFRLHITEDLTQRQIGERMNVGECCIAKHLRDARTHLQPQARQLLEPCAA